MVLLHVECYSNYAAAMGPLGKVIAEQKEVVSCYNGFTDPSQQIVSLWDQNVCCLLSILLPERDQTTIDTSMSQLKYGGLAATLHFATNTFARAAVHVSLIFSSSKYYRANVKVPRQQDRYQTGDFIVSHGTHEWNVTRSSVLLSRSHSQDKWDVLFFLNNQQTLHGCWIGKISLVKSCSSILLTSKGKHN